MADAHDEFPSLAVTQYWFFGGFTKMIVELIHTFKLMLRAELRSAEPFSLMIIRSTAFPDVSVSLSRDDGSQEYSRDRLEVLGPKVDNNNHVMITRIL